MSKVMQGSVPPGTRRVHLSKLRDRDRRLIVSQLVPENLRALYVSARGRQTDARSECWRMVVPQLVGLGVVKLTVEQVDDGGKPETSAWIHRPKCIELRSTSTTTR